MYRGPLEWNMLALEIKTSTLIQPINYYKRWSLSFYDHIWATTLFCKPDPFRVHAFTCVYHRVGLT